MMVSDIIAIGFSFKRPRGDTNLPFGVEKRNERKRRKYKVSLPPGCPTTSNQIVISF